MLDRRRRRQVVYRRFFVSLVVAGHRRLPTAPPQRSSLVLTSMSRRRSSSRLSFFVEMTNFTLRRDRRPPTSGIMYRVVLVVSSVESCVVQVESQNRVVKAKIACRQSRLDVDDRDRLRSSAPTSSCPTLATTTTMRAARSASHEAKNQTATSWLLKANHSPSHSHSLGCRRRARRRRHHHQLCRRLSSTIRTDSSHRRTQQAAPTDAKSTRLDWSVDTTENTSQLTIVIAVDRQRRRRTRRPCVVTSSSIAADCLARRVTSSRRAFGQTTSRRLSTCSWMDTMQARVQ